MNSVVAMYPPRLIPENAVMDSNVNEELEFVLDENSPMNKEEGEDVEGVRAAKKRKICDN